jgi:hypothetical protein
MTKPNEQDQPEPIPIREDLVARIKRSIKAGHYDETTPEGRLALELTVDKLMARKEQISALPRCKWDGSTCALAECRNGCRLDRRFAELTLELNYRDRQVKVIGPEQPASTVESLVGEVCACGALLPHVRSCGREDEPRQSICSSCGATDLGPDHECAGRDA